MMVGSIHEMHSKRISITTTNYLTRRFVFAGAEIPPSLDWRDVWMIRASELRQPQPAAVITGMWKLPDPAEVLR
jgi:hypothetical protein